MGRGRVLCHTIGLLAVAVTTPSTAFQSGVAVPTVSRPCVGACLEASSRAWDSAGASDMTSGGRAVTIVTTAALPWMTGTSINPLMRAMFLADPAHDLSVSLVLPWVDPEEGDQEHLFHGKVFETPAQQEESIRRWMQDVHGDDFRETLAIHWYPARYHPNLKSILFDIRHGNLVDHMPEDSRDIVLLEEPEHINWFHHGPRWADRFDHVVGIAHTNYIEYTRNDKGGWFKAPVQYIFSSLVFRAYCDVIVQLSSTLDDSGAPPEISTVCNVHGVRDQFLAIGRERSTRGEDASRGGVYFLGKKLWTKGYRELLDLLDSDAARAQLLPTIRLIGSGPDEDVITAEAEDLDLDVLFQPAIDHADASLHDFHVFVNPSTSDVLCTATAEALAMGKIALIARHPSNQFFYQFSNCITFDNAEEFTEALLQAEATLPTPLSEEETHVLSWAAATSRLFDAVKLPSGVPRPSLSTAATLSHWLHLAIGYGVVGDVIRDLTGARPNLALTQWLLKSSESQDPRRALLPFVASSIFAPFFLLQGIAQQATDAAEPPQLGSASPRVLLARLREQRSTLLSTPPPWQFSMPLKDEPPMDGTEVWQRARDALPTVPESLRQRIPKFTQTLLKDDDSAQVS